MTDGRGAVAEITVTAPETGIGIGIARERDAATGKETGPTAVEEVIVAIGNETETAKTAKRTEGANVTKTKSLKAKNVPRGRGLMMTLTKRMVAQVIALARVTETVLPTANPEVGLLSIHETNSMIHPDIEEIGITVVEKVGALSRTTRNSRTVVIGQKARCPLQGVYFSFYGTAYSLHMVSLPW